MYNICQRPDPRAGARSQPPASSCAAFGHHHRQKVEVYRMGLNPAVPIPQQPLGLPWHIESSPGMACAKC